MAKLTRVTGKVFGGSAPLNKIGQFGSALAGNPTNTQDVATIQALEAYSKGWGSAVISSRQFPPIEEVTGALKTISYQACYLLQEGIPEYDINTEYSNTSIVKGINNGIITLYASLANNNIGNSLTNTTYWQAHPLDVTLSQVQAADAVLSGQINTLSGQITSLQTTVDGKANKSLNNVTSGAFGNVLSTASSTNKVTVSGWFYPNWTQKVSKEANTSYTAGQKGWVCARAESGNAQASLEVNGITVAETYPKGGQDYGAFACLVPVDWADTYQLISTTTTNRYLYFIPIKGY